MLKIYNFNGALDEISCNYLIIDNDGIVKNSKGTYLYEPNDELM